MNRTFIEGRVTLGLLGGQCPHPARDRVGSLRAKSMRVKEGALVEGTARGGRAGLAGVTAHRGCAATRLCEALPIRHGTAVTPSPLGKAAGWGALRRGSPTVTPLRPVARVPFQGLEAATSCGGRRRLLLLLRPCGTLDTSTVRSLPVQRSPPFCAQRGRPTGAARSPADNVHNLCGGARDAHPAADAPQRHASKKRNPPCPLASSGHSCYDDPIDQPGGTRHGYSPLGTHHPPSPH